MKSLVLIGLLACPDFAPAEAIVPKSYDPIRYSESLTKSPFVLETKPDGPTDPHKKRIGDGFYLRGVSKNPDGNWYVLFQRLGQTKAAHLEGNNPGEDGLMIKDVRIGATFGETKVTLQQGSETDEIGFKEGSITAPPPRAPKRSGPGAPPFPGVAPTPVQILQPATTPPSPPPQRPRVRVIGQ